MINLGRVSLGDSQTQALLQKERYFRKSLSLQAVNIACVPWHSLLAISCMAAQIHPASFMHMWPQSFCITAEFHVENESVSTYLCFRETALLLFYYFYFYFFGVAVLNREPFSFTSFFLFVKLWYEIADCTV